VSVETFESHGRRYAVRVQWETGAGGAGVRSWALVVGKVHERRRDEPWRTLCGRIVPKASKVLPVPDKPGEGNDCKRCARAAREGVGL
jgi:hypothetical protein